MILLTHIVIALGSVAYTTYLYIAPTRAKVRVSYGLMALTLASGTYLVVSTGAHVLQACMSGLLYVGLVSLGIFSAQRKLALQKTRK